METGISSGNFLDIGLQSGASQCGGIPISEQNNLLMYNIKTKQGSLIKLILEDSIWEIPIGTGSNIRNAKFL